ncbi:MAG: TlpA family protein disulfide reductase [Lachnospiraceae bacterium]|nr:TlpA family protein disulfide reductase [Lachnospiraceae bacterium]
MKRRTLLTLAAVLIPIAAAIIYFTLWGEAPREDKRDDHIMDDALATPEDALPSELVHGKKVPYTEFSDAEGNKVSLEDYYGEPLWILSWASWCPDCKDQLLLAEAMKQAAAERGVRLLLIDRLNPKKESVENALAELAGLDVELECIFDRDEVAYKAWGIKMIPTSVFLDAEGCVVAMDPNVMSVPAFESVLDEVVGGHGSKLYDFVKREMLMEDGGVITGSDSTGNPSGSDVLSESEGLLMTYAVMTEDRETYDLVKDYAIKNLYNSGLFAWYASGSEKPDSDALIDDMRIWYAMDMAAEKWGEDEISGEIRLEIQDAIYEKLLNKKVPVNCINFSSGAQSGDIALFYLNIDLFQRLEKRDRRFHGVTNKVFKIIEEGYISADMPGYYSSYNLKKDQYSSADLNMAEELCTMYYMAKEGRLKTTTYDWLKRKILRGELSAAYTVKGEVPEGYEYHSTAVYALAALIADEMSDTRTREIAIRRMERFRVRDVNSSLDGGFSADGKNFRSFDQLIPLFVYERLR